MALSINRLKGKIKAAWLSEIENENEIDYLEIMSEKIATAIVEEILQLTVTVPAGIKVSTTGTATAQTGATTENKIAELQ